MTYATQTDLEDAFGADELTQLLTPHGFADTAVLAAALARADGLINSYLAGRYLVPLTPVPAVVLGMAVDLTRYFLYDDAVPERVRVAYEDAIAWLKDVARGTVTLGLPPETTPAGTGSGVAITSSPRRFGVDAL